MQNIPTILISWNKNNSANNYIEWIRRMGFNYSYEAGDLLLVIGGIDIGLNPERDKHEYDLINKFKSEGKPIFGICRGMQMLGKMEGLTLHEHLPDVTLLEHRAGDNEQSKDSEFHSVKCYDENNTFQEFQVNSRHHQGFLLEKAREEWMVSIDDVVEGIKRDYFSSCQFHPERIEMKDTIAEKIIIDEINKLLKL